MEERNERELNLINLTEDEKQLWKDLFFDLQEQNQAFHHHIEQQKKELKATIEMRNDFDSLSELVSDDRPKLKEYVTLMSNQLEESVEALNIQIEDAVERKEELVNIMKELSNDITPAPQGDYLGDVAKAIARFHSVMKVYIDKSKHTLSKGEVN